MAQIKNILWGKIWVWGLSIHEKKLSLKISCNSPFNKERLQIKVEQNVPYLPFAQI